MTTVLVIAGIAAIMVGGGFWYIASDLFEQSAALALGEDPKPNPMTPAESVAVTHDPGAIRMCARRPVQEEAHDDI